MATQTVESVIAKLNDTAVQTRVRAAARAAVRKQLEAEGITLTPEIWSQIANKTPRDNSTSDILAAGAVLIGVLSL